MKKLFIVLGSNAERILRDPVALSEIAPRGMRVEIKVPYIHDHEVLENVSNILQAETNGQYQNILVVYSGDNTILLPSSLPCDYLDVSLLKRKLIGTVGGYATSSQIEMVDSLLIGGIIRLTHCKNKPMASKFNFVHLDMKLDNFGPTSRLLRKKYHPTKEDIGKIFYSDPSKKIGYIVTRGEFITINPNEVGGWLEISDVDTL